MTTSLLLFGLLRTLSISAWSTGQKSGYSQTNLVSNVAGVASGKDALGRSLP
jgi:hypothetical protein